MDKNVVSFGEIMMRLKTPEYNLMTQTNMLEYSFSGTGVNFASAMTTFGHKGYLVSKVPGNSVGDAALSYIRSLGIQDDYITRNGNYLGMYFLENGFGARPSRVTYTNRKESSFNTALSKSYDIDNIARSADVVHFCGISLAMPDNVHETIKMLAKKVKRYGGNVVFDCNYRPSLWEGGYNQAKRHYEEMLTLADIVMMNEKDAIYILGYEAEEIVQRQQLLEVIPKVAEKFRIRTIAGTHRSVIQDNVHTLEGYIYKNGIFTFSDRLSFSVHDRIGSGDAFAAGVLHSEIKGFSPEKSVQFASVSGMLACTIIGDTPMSTETEILSVMSRGTSDVQR